MKHDETSVTEETVGLYYTHFEPNTLSLRSLSMSRIFVAGHRGR